ncbi:MAG: hypothetical protein M0R06_03065 [Sphaerochaeta sp.]|jgi:hypothetical protein|nr:hypothetical protein [Sphaerochaeta sp.]
MANQQADIVQKWRADNKEELDTTLRVLIGIRDNPNEETKERVNACKAIAKMFGGMAPDHGDVSAKSKKPEKPILKDELETGIEAVLGRIS